LRLGPIDHLRACVMLAATPSYFRGRRCAAFPDGNNWPIARVLSNRPSGPKEARMQVHVNHDNHVRLAGDTADRLAQTIEDALAKFADMNTRVEMHISDENAGKGGTDKRCMFEARMSNVQPI